MWPITPAEEKVLFLTFLAHFLPETFPLDGNDFFLFLSHIPVGGEVAVLPVGGAIGYFPLPLSTTSSETVMGLGGAADRKRYLKYPAVT